MTVDTQQRDAAEARHQRWAWTWCAIFIVWALVTVRWPLLRVYVGSTVLPAYYLGKHHGWLRRHKHGPTS
jgi:ABC-type Fe3+ transport system permease subunit